MNSYTTSDLCSDILLMGHVPTGNNTFTNETLLQLANMELQTPIMKQILSTRGGYYLTYADYDPTSDGLYLIPPGAIAGALAHVEMIDSTSIHPVAQMEFSEQFSTTAPSIPYTGFFMRGNYVQILPVPTQTVRLWYHQRPSDLILTSKASQVSSINGAILTVASIPSTIVVGSLVDVLGDQPPFHILASSAEILDITGTDITLDLTVTDLSEGDWIALHNQTPIPQIPVEFRILLAQRVVVKINELQGYDAKLKASQMKLIEYEKSTLNLITPRVKSKTKVISPVSGGFMKKGRRWLCSP